MHRHSHRFSSVSRLLTLLLLSLSLIPAVSAQANPKSKIQNPKSDNPYGVNLFLHKEVEPAKIEQTLKMVADANIQWIKQEFPWQEIEFKKGYFYDDKWQKSSWEKFDRIVDLADKYHLKLIARIDHAPDWAKDKNAPLKHNKDLADFINAFLDHYKGRVDYIQVWNEPNLSAEWVPGKPVNPKDYAEMLKTVYPAVKVAHPDATLISAPLAMTLETPESRGNMNELDYWSGMYAAGVKGYFDIASANGYGLDQPPDAPPDPKVINFRRVELLHNIMAQNGDGDRPVWLAEYGWNASPESLSPEEKNYWRHVTPQQQADWTVAGIEYARRNWPWAGVVAIWYFRQVGDITPDKAEYYFAMVNPDFSTQPVYDAVKADAARYPGPSSQGQASEPTVTPVPTAAETPTSAPAEATATAIVAPTITSTASPLASPTVTAPPTGTIADAGNYAWLYAVGGALVLAGLAGLGYYFAKRK